MRLPIGSRIRLALATVMCVSLACAPGVPSKKMAHPCVGAGKRANSHELNAQGVLHQQRGKFEFAEACYKAALKKKPDFVVALFNVGTLRLALGDDRGAINVFNEVLTMQPTYASAHYNMGSAYYRLGQERQAVTSFRAAVEVDPNYVHAHANLATVLHLQGDLDGAKKHHQESIRIDPGFADGWMNLGNVLKALGQVPAAIQAYNTATTLKPSYAMAFYNLGVAHQGMGNHSAAVEAYQSATQLDANLVNAHYNLGLALQALGDLEAAVKALAAATARDGGLALSAQLNLGTVLDQLGRLPEAIQAYTAALHIVPEGDSTEASVLANLWLSLQASMCARACACACACVRACACLRNPLLFLQAVCDWEAMAKLEGRLMRLVEALMRADAEARVNVAPFHSIIYPFSAPLALRIARVHAATQSPAVTSGPLYAISALLPAAGSPRALRLGFVVDAPTNGSVSHYLPSVLASIDRRAVQASVYLLQDASLARPAFVSGVGAHCHAVRDLSRVLRAGSPRGAAEAAANVISSDAIHVLLDMSDSAVGVRHPLLALEPAPLQMSCGLLASQGADYLHLALADHVSVPPEYAPHWAERLVLMHASVFVNDFQRSLRGVLSLPAARDASIRGQFGLPTDGILLCSFGEAHKLDASMLRVWARILARTPAATLWLPRYNALAEENLRTHARQLGLAEDRLVFSPPALRCLGGKCTRHSGKGSLVLSDSEYLAAALAADIYLDTGPSVGSPLALASLMWAAVPAVTLAGERAVARTSASFLLAAADDGMGWLVATTAEEYEDLAVALAANPRSLADLRQRLTRLRAAADGSTGEESGRAGLYDVVEWAKGLSAAALAAWETFAATGRCRHLRLTRNFQDGGSGLPHA